MKKNEKTMKKKRKLSKFESNRKKKLPATVREIIDPLDFASGTRAITLNLPIALWEEVDRIVPSRGKNKFFIALLTQFLKNQRTVK